MNISKPRRAFSLLEVAIVIVIIGLLIVGVVGSRHLIAKSRLTTAMAMTRSSVIASILGNRLWLETSLSDVSLGEGLSTGDAITSWIDGSSHKSSVTISAVGTGATYANTINHVQAVKFDENSASNHLQIDNASFLNGTDYTIFITDKRIGTNSGDGNYLLGSDGSFALGYESGTTMIQTHGEAADDDNQASIESLSSYSNKPRAITFTHSSTDGNKIYINGTLANEDTTSTAKAHLSGITTLAIGNNYNGEIGEIAIFDRDLSTAERRDIENYMTDKWASPNNRDTTESCTSGTITSTGCDNSCSVSINGVSTTTVSDGSSGSFTCSATGYDSDDTISYSCSGASLSFSGDQYCSCDDGYILSSGSGSICVQGCSVATITGTSDSGTTVANGTTVSCDEEGYDGSTIATCSSGNSITGSCNCGDGYNSDGGECRLQCTMSSGDSGLDSDISVDSGSSSYDCTDTEGYTGTVTYTCSNGSISGISGSCTSSEVSCEGGTIDTTSISGYTMHIYTTAGTSSFSCDENKNVEVLVVAGGGGGGGGGGSAGGAGGGAGGLIYSSSLTLTSFPVTVVVGAGGSGGPGNSYNTSGAGSNGGNSQFYTLTAIGGGGSSGREDSSASGGSGGSGGGGGVSGTSKGGGSSTSGQGNAGGANWPGGPNYGGGGGGGAGAAGQRGSSTKGGDGGVGLDYSNEFSANYGESGYFAGGGGASFYVSGGTYGSGGSGGGGDVGSAGIANTGGGGGGGTSSSSSGGAGGSGIVIVKYMSGPPTTCPVSVTGVSTTSVSVDTSGSLSCNSTGYSGSVSYSCNSEGSLSTTGSCSCDTGSNYTDSNSDGVCEASCTITSANSGLPSNLTVLSGSTSYDCTNVSGYSGTLTYTCSDGTAGTVTEACVSSLPEEETACYQEASSSGSITITAPSGKTFSSIAYSDFGNGWSTAGACVPHSNCNPFAEEVEQIIQDKCIGQSTCTLDYWTDFRTPLVTDPCPGIVKKVQVKLRYR